MYLKDKTYLKMTEVGDCRTFFTTKYTLTTDTKV